MKRLIILFILSSLGGCIEQPTMEELEKEAIETGDWSKVQRREERLGNREPAINCPEGTVVYCKEWGNKKRCGCVTYDQLERGLRGY